MIDGQTMVCHAIIYKIIFHPNKEFFIPDSSNLMTNKHILYFCSIFLSITKRIMRWNLLIFGKTIPKTIILVKQSLWNNYNFLKFFKVLLIHPDTSTGSCYNRLKHQCIYVCTYVRMYILMYKMGYHSWKWYCQKLSAFLVIFPSCY